MKLREYYKHYISLHQNLWCRRLHVIGQFFTILFVFFTLHNQLWFLLLFSPFVIYPFAWSGHYFFEKNKPAAFKNPIYAKLSDLIMLKQWILGEIER